MKKGWIRFEWSIALVGSLVLHAALVGWMVRNQIRELADALARGTSAFRWVMLVQAQPVEDFLGDDQGKGSAIAMSDGDRPAQGLESDLDQPLLSRDLVGQGHLGDAPSPYTGPTGHGALAAAMRQSWADADSPAIAPLMPEHMPSPIAQAQPMRPPGKRESTIGPRIQTPEKPTPLLVADAAPVPAPVAPSLPTVAHAAQRPSSELPSASADPAPLSDSEIDVFSKTASVEFRAGHTTVRGGRKATLTRPHIPIVGLWDSVALGRAEVTLHLTLNDAGHVILATIDSSSGSNEIDNPIRLEAYNWSFEPRKNRAGQFVEADFPFQVTIYR